MNPQLYSLYFRGVKGQKLESRGRVEDERTRKRPCTTQILNIIQKVPETVIHLKAGEELWRATRRNKGQVDKKELI